MTDFDAKAFQLINLAAAGMKYEYRILAHSARAKKAGAADEEIKSDIMMADNFAIKQYYFIRESVRY